MIAIDFLCTSLTLYTTGCTVTGTSTTGFAAAIALAQQSDYVILVLGLDSAVEAEGHDRVNITLPGIPPFTITKFPLLYYFERLGVQDQFAQAIVKLGKPTAVVLINGGAIAIEDLQASPVAILEAFYPGIK